MSEVDDLVKPGPKKTFLEKLTKAQRQTLFAIRKKWLKEHTATVPEILERIIEKWGFAPCARRSFNDFLNDNGTIYKEVE